MINAIILAAGKGTRMKTDLPKCAFPILEKPMIKYIMDALDKTKVDKKIVVVGYKKEVFYELLNDVYFAEQVNQLGTADAVKAALNYIDDDGISLIIPGDTPLINYEKINSSFTNKLNEINDIKYKFHAQLVRKDSLTTILFSEEDNTKGSLNKDFRNNSIKLEKSEEKEK